MNEKEKPQPNSQQVPLSESNDFAEKSHRPGYYPTQDVSNTFQPPANPHRNDSGGNQKEQ